MTLRLSLKKKVRHTCIDLFDLLFQTILKNIDPYSGEMYIEEEKQDLKFLHEPSVDLLVTPSSFDRNFTNKAVPIKLTL